LLQQAELQWQQGKLAAAQRLYRTFLDRFPDYKHNHLIMVRLADLLQQQHLLREALEGYAKVITTYPASEGALISQVRMAELGVRRPDLLPNTDEPQFHAYRHPIQALQTLIQTYPVSPLADVARFKLGVLQLQRGELQAALASFRHLAQKSLQPGLQQNVRQQLGQTLQRLLVAQQRQKAFIDVLRTFFANREYLAPEDAQRPDFLLPVAISYARLGLYSEAQSMLQKLVEGAATPAQRTTAALEQASLLSKRGQPQEAITLLEPFISTAKPAVRGRLLLTLGELASQAQQPAKAIHYLDMASELVLSPPERLRLFSLLADNHLAQGDAEHGLRALRQCAALTAEGEDTLLPGVDSCLFRAASLLFEHHQYQPALAEYQRLLQAFPETRYHDRTLFGMARIYRELGDEAQMIRTLETLRDSGVASLWREIAADSLDDLAWQKRFRERLAVLQNLPMK
jgi:tetratricopeptide (TPR) repeat protein